MQNIPKLKPNTPTTLGPHNIQFVNTLVISSVRPATIKKETIIQ